MARPEHGLCHVVSLVVLFHCQLKASRTRYSHFGYRDDPGRQRRNCHERGPMHLASLLQDCLLLIVGGKKVDS